MQWRDFFRWRSWRSALRGARPYIFGGRRRRPIHRWRLSYRLRMLMVLFSKGAIGDIVDRQRVRLWVDKEAFHRIRKLIARARHTVIIQMFIWQDDAAGRRMAQVLVEAADRGVRVDITKETVGDFFELQADFLSTKEDTNPLWRRFWNHSNIRVHHTAHQDHAKVYVIDGEVMLLTGMNIGDEYEGRWHDYMVELHGSAFVQQFLTHSTSGEAQGIRLVMNTERQKRIRPVVRELLRSAKHSIVIEQSYLSDPEVLETLIKRSRNGISVTVILPSTADVHHYLNMQSAERLVREGSLRHMRVFLYPGMIHGKIVLVDRARAFVGSANLIASSLDEMGEVNVLIERRFSPAVQKLQRILREDILKSRPLRTAPGLRWVARWMAWMNL